MLKNDIEKTLQAHSPVPPEGFAERMDRKVISLMQQKEQAPVKKKSRYRKPVIALAAALVLCFVTAASRDLIIRPDTIRARETATPLVTALSEGKGEETGTGTETLSANALKMFETNFPGIAGELKPVNLSVEKQGIRMEVISALEKGNEAWIVYSLQDLEGDRVTRFATTYDGLYGTRPGSGYSCYLDYNEAEHKITCVNYTEFDGYAYPEDNFYSFRVEDVGADKQIKLDLLPYLKEYGKASEGVKMPDDAIVYSPSKVLDYTNPLDVRLEKDFYLTGIGWIDNKLHVQVQDRQQERITIGSRTIPPMVIGVAALYAEKPEKEVTTERAMWSSVGDGYRDMSEFILGIQPDEADKIRLEAWIHEITEVVKDTWEVQIPLADILLTAEEPAAREEETESGGNIEEEPQWKATLQAFFEDWALKDTDYLLNVCADAWKEGQADPEQAVKELVDARRPAGYRINGIAGQDGDPVRMLDVTVRWLGEDGGDTYTRHEVALRLQRVTWAMDAYRVDPEGFSAGEPAEPVQEREMVLLTEESILRNALRFYPELRDHPVPINLSVEKQGIRMEVVSGCLQEDKASFLVIVRDVEGKYNGLDLQLVHIANNEGFLSLTSSERYRNKAENYSVWVYEMELPDPMPSESDSLNLNMNKFHAKKEATIDLVPLLKEHAGTEDGVAPPEDARSLSDVVAPVTGDMKVLSYDASQEKIPLFGNLFLSGIGWIDGQLHVQLYVQQPVLNKGYGMSAYGAVDGENVQADVGMISWDEWSEYVFNCDPDDVDRMTLETHLTEYEESLYDDWSVEIPMNMLLQKDAAEPAEKENDPDSAYQSALWTFFRDWVLGNTDRVENALTYHAEPDRPDEAEAAKEIMAAGTPRAYKLHGISGTKGDPVRTLDVTVQWDAEDGGYRYTRHALEIWLQMNRNGWFEYEINPAGLINSLPAEAVPETELTLVTEEAFLRDTMDAHVEEVAYDELAPIGLSMEKQGIRMEVVSGCRKGDNAYFLLTTQELNGEYSDYSCDPPHDLQTEDGTVYGHYIRLGINRTENKITWLYSVDLSKAPLAENNALRVGIEELDFKEEREVDLLPLLELDGRTEEGITLPENYPVFTIDGKRAEDGLKVLNDEGSLDIHLDGNTYLSAIGWIGDQLHVQLVEKNEKSPDPDYEYMHLFVNCSVTGKPYEEIRVDGSPVSWFNLQNETSREEYIFNCTPEDVDSMRLYGYGTIMRATLRDDWTVEVPLDLLPDLTAAEPADREEEAELPADDWTAALENKRPGLLKDLKPLNLHTIEQGIRMEVISALIRDQRLYVVYSAEDLEGGRLKADPVITFEPSLDYNTSSLIRLDYDTEKQKKVTYLEEFELVYPAEADQKITLQFGGLGAREAKRVDLLPLLEKYGKDAAVTALPENTSLLAHDQLSISSADVLMYPEILDYTQPLEESMGGTLSLSGIGWIDNKLHVQFHDADPSSVRIDNTHYPSWSASAGAEIGDGDESRSVEYDKLSWKSAGEAKGEWDEYVLEISPDEAERMTLSAFVTHIEKILNVACRFELPAGLVMAEWPWDADPETAAPAA